jgi:signal transduction histidine kinase
MELDINLREKLINMLQFIKSKLNISNSSKMKSINQVLRKNLILLSVIIILMVALIINGGIQLFFRTYLKNTRIEKDEKVLQVVKEMMEDNSLDTVEAMILNQMSKNNSINMYVEVNGDMIYATKMSFMGKGVGHHGIGKRNIPDISSTKEFSYKEYNLDLENSVMGKAYIGRFDKLIVSDEDNSFVWAINMLFIIVVLLAFIIVIIVSKYLSEKLSRPIINIKNGTEVIAKGDYSNVKIEKVDTIELNQLAIAVEELANKLNNEEILRKRMTTDIAHELRSPLAVLRSHIEAMIDGVFEINVERLEKCYIETTRLTTLINDLNELSSTESSLNKMDLKKVDVNEVIQEAVSSFKPMYNKKHIKLNVNIGESSYMLGDKEKLIRLMSNFLSNAYRYCNVDGEVNIYKKVVQDEIVITIKDNGIGIDKEDLPYIFERLYRSDLSRNRETGGAGIGLAIVESIVTAHKGRIEVDSELSKGTEFRIFFKTCES